MNALSAYVVHDYLVWFVACPNNKVVISAGTRNEARLIFANNRSIELSSYIQAKRRYKE
jgi:hypothetical protein